MATKAITRSEINGVAGTVHYRCAGMAAGDWSAPIECGNFADKSLHLHGSFGGNVKLYGSNREASALANADPATAGNGWVLLTDTAGAAITKTANSITQVLQNPRYLCVAAETGVTATDADLFAKA